jgi:hypothetical protein
MSAYTTQFHIVILNAYSGHLFYQRIVAIQGTLIPPTDVQHFFAEHLFILENKRSIREVVATKTL